MSQIVTVSTKVELEVIECTAPGCGVVFGIPIGYARERRRDHGGFYCPNGHSRCWPGESDLERLERQLASASGNLKFERERSERLSREVDHQARRVAAQKGAKTRLINRAKAGLCILCDRQFASLEQHMAAEHSAEQIDDVINAED